MNETLRTYDGIWFAESSSEQRAGIRSAANAVGIEFDITDSYIELQFRGRDTNRFVVECLSVVASILGEAEGEIRCSVVDDERDERFEFYTVRGGRLHKQLGTIVRDGAPKVV